jgi:4-amino-4-deoxy-L-arabinose transferase-like glycosyltransferase
MKQPKHYFIKYRFAGAFWVLVFIRAFFNAILPLMDKTEARYGEIARLMSSTGNWITPQIDYGVPFWAKPPLSTWFSALSISLFGSAEFFVRLPYLLIFVGIAYFIKRYRNSNQQSIYFPGIVLLSIPEFYLHAGVVSTDSFLTLSIALVMFGFWEAVQDQSNRFWGYLFFMGLGIGLLAKGPIVGVLTLPPIFIWAVITQNVKKTILKLPWLGGILLMLTLSVPWYFIAEITTPGFIDYFIVGEHYERYFNPEWKGDKYGFPKQQPLGMAWIFLFVFILPWSIACFRLLIKKRKGLLANHWILFLLFWALWTPLFFTTSKSLIHPYILPSCIPIALIITHYWSSLKTKKRYSRIALGVPVILFVVSLSGWAKPIYAATTDKYILENLDQTKAIYSLERKSYSSQFYSKGKIKVVGKKEFEFILDSNSPSYILLENRQWEKLSAPLKERLILINSNKKKGVYSTSN